jgi:hypothetical protein
LGTQSRSLNGLIYQNEDFHFVLMPAIHLLQWIRGIPPLRLRSGQALGAMKLHPSDEDLSPGAPELCLRWGALRSGGFSRIQNLSANR